MHRDEIGEGIFSIPLPRIGPMPQKDVVGINLTVLLLQQYLDPERYRYYLQWDSLRSYSIEYGNMWRPGVNGLVITTLRI